MEGSGWGNYTCKLSCFTFTSHVLWYWSTELVVWLYRQFYLKATHLITCNIVCSQKAAWCLVTWLYWVKVILVFSSVLTKSQVWEMKLSRSNLYLTLFCSVISEDIVTKSFTRFALHILCKVLGFLSNVNHWHIERPECLVCWCSYGMFGAAECCLLFLFSI
jgi:hypothetical protein